MTQFYFRLDALSQAIEFPTRCLRATRQHEENQSNTRVLNKVLEAIDPIVTATVRYEQRPTVFCNLHEAGLIALGRAVETLSASCCKNKKWRGGIRYLEMLRSALGH